MILNDDEILARAETGMITPYLSTSVNKAGEDKLLSFGVSSYGYDVRLSSERFRIFSNLNALLIDPKSPSENTLIDAVIHTTLGREKYVIIPPHSYGLGSTIETFDIPRDIMIICLGKSTYARHGIIINVTPIEPGFKGQVVIEIANTTPLPAKVYLEEGIAQFLFFQGNPCSVSYGDRNGKYQHQTGITLGRA